MENHDLLKEMFARYLDDHCSPEEVRQLLQYFQVEEDPSRLRKLIEEQLAKPVDPDFENSPEGQAFFENVHRSIRKTIREEETATKPRKLWPRVAVAAAMIVLVGMSWIYRDQLLNLVDPVEVEYTVTEKGQRQQLLLADGSRVWLSTESSLEYPESFRGKTREVVLKGEAFFEVATDKAHPFIIRTGEVSTRVLGTSFNVQAYEEQDIAVTVLTGAVSVAAMEDDGELKTPVELSPNQRAVFRKETRSLVKEEAPDAIALLDRREGIFHYRGDAVTEILSDVAREYKVEIKAEGNLANCAFYGTKKPDDDVFRFLEKVALTINAKIRQEGNTIYFTGSGC